MLQVNKDDDIELMGGYIKEQSKATEDSVDPERCV